MMAEVHYAYTTDGLVFFKSSGIMFGSQVCCGDYWVIDYWLPNDNGNIGKLKLVDNPVWGLTIGKLATVTDLNKPTTFYYSYDDSLHAHARRVECIKLLMSGEYDDMSIYQTGVFPLVINQTLDFMDIRSYGENSGLFYFKYMNPRSLKVSTEMLNLCEKTLKHEQGQCDMYRRYRDAAERLREDRLMIIDNLMRWKEGM